LQQGGEFVESHGVPPVQEDLGQERPYFKVLRATDP
jgi:hypothetical protein